MCRYDYRLFFSVELVEEPIGAEIEGAARLVVGRATLRSVVKTPARGSAGDGAAQVGEEVGGSGFPSGISSSKRFLMQDRDGATNLLHQSEALTSADVGLRGRLGTSGPMRAEEVKLGGDKGYRPPM